MVKKRKKILKKKVNPEQMKLKMLNMKQEKYLKKKKLKNRQ